MRHPFELLSPRTARRLYWLFFAATLLLIGVLQSLGAQFADRPGPSGETYDIVAFELAHTPGKAEAILAAWGPEGIGAAIRQTWLDYLFLLTYSNAIALGILAVVHGSGGRGAMASLGRALAWSQWLAAVLDAIENAALLRILHGVAATPWPEIAFYCATVKFALVGLGLLYILALLPLVWQTTHTPKPVGLPADE